MFAVMEPLRFTVWLFELDTVVVFYVQIMMVAVWKQVGALFSDSGML